MVSCLLLRKSIKCRVGPCGNSGTVSAICMIKAVLLFWNSSLNSFSNLLVYELLKMEYIKNINILETIFKFQFRRFQNGLTLLQLKDWDVANFV